MTELMARPAQQGIADPGVRRFRPDIQGLRAVAVMLVVLYHAGVPGIRGGYVGVDVFFVISGFLITQHLDRELVMRGKISLVGFYGRRARRLLPPAALVLGVTLLVGRLVMPYSQLASLTKDAYYAAFYGINYHLALEGINYQNASLPPSPLQHFWSLAVEEQFYVVWPILIMACATLAPRRHRRAGLLLAISALTGASLFLSVTTTETDGSMAYFGLHTRAWELGVGALLALGVPMVRRLPAAGARCLGFAGLAAIVVSGLVYTEATPFPGSAALIPVVGAAAVIAAGVNAVERSVETRLLGRGPMQHVGRTSYAWYLWHWPMLILLPIWAGADLNLAERLEVVVIAYWFAILTYFLENASARSVWQSARWAATGLALSSGMLVAASVTMLLLPNVNGTGAVVDSVSLSSAELTPVKQAIARGLATTAVPKNLKPTLSKAPQDSPFEGRADCFADLPVTKSPECVFGDKKGRRTAVLVGDSHADQWLNALEVQAKVSGWRIVQLTKAACPVARLTVQNDDLNRTYTECRTFQANRARQVAKLHPDLIIASQADAIGVANKIAPQRWSRATLDELRGLSGGTARVVYIGDSSFASVDPVTCLQSHLDDAKACVSPRFNSTAMQATYESLKHDMSVNKIAYVPTIEMFCTAKECPPVIDDMLTHRDQGHVTRTYAQWLSPMFATVFSGAAS